MPEGKHQNLVTRRVTLRNVRPQQIFSFLWCKESTQSKKPWGVTLSSFINSHNRWITPLHRGSRQIGLVSERPTQDNPRKKNFWKIDGRVCMCVCVCVRPPLDIRSHQRKKKNTSRPQPALKGETETGIDLKKGCWTATVGRPAFGKSSQICR